MKSLAAGLREVLALRATEAGRLELAARLERASVESPLPAVVHLVDVAPRVHRLGVPKPAIDGALKGNPTPALVAAREWWARGKAQRPALVLLGDVGLGKTVAAAWVLLEWARTWGWNAQPTGMRGEPAVWLDGPRLRCLGAWGDEAARLLDDTAHARVAVLDDAGWEGDQRSREGLAGILLERANHLRPTVLTSNLKGEAFRARYGSALCDRYLGGGALIPKLVGASLRKAAP